MLVRAVVAGALAAAGGLTVMPAAAQTHEICTPTVRINRECPASCNETLKVSGWPYVNAVLRVCT